MNKELISKINTSQILSFTAVGLSIFNTFLIFRHYHKNNVKYFNKTCLYISLLIAFIWFIHGFIVGKIHISLAYFIILTLLLAMVYLF
jgi:hypothetical protein